MINNNDAGRLILRTTTGGLLLFHGIHKLTQGFGGIQHMLDAKGLPHVLWMGVPVAEVVAPAALILGWATRLSSAVIIVNMLMTFIVGLGASAFLFNKQGGLNSELNLFYLLTAAAIIFLGPGRFRIYRTTNSWLI